MYVRPSVVFFFAASFSSIIYVPFIHTLIYKKKKKKENVSNQTIIDFQYLAQLVEIHTITDSESGMTTTQQQQQQNNQQQYQFMRQHQQQVQRLGGGGAQLSRHRPNVISTNNFDDLTCRYDNGTSAFKAKS